MTAVATLWLFRLGPFLDLAAAAPRFEDKQRTRRTRALAG
jgi:hypothetical protein